MARIVRSKVITEIVSSTSFTPTLPVHENGDLILAFMGCDINNTYSTVSSGWTRETFTNSSASAGCFSFYATSSSSTDPTFSSSTTRKWGVIYVVVKDAPTSAAVDDAQSTGVEQYRGLTQIVTTTITNDLIIDYIIIEQNQRQPFFEPEINQINQLNGELIGFGNGSCVGWHVQQASGASTGHTFANGGNVDALVKVAIAIKDDGNANYPAYVDPAIPPAELITPWAGSNTLPYYDDGTKDVDPTSLITTINGSTATFRADQAETDIVPFISSCGYNITSSGDWNKHLVYQRGVGNVWDLSGDALLSFSSVLEAPSVGFAVGAQYIGIGSGDSANVATAAKLFQFESNDSKVNSSNGNSQFVIQPSRMADDTYGTINLSAVEKIFSSSYVENSGQDSGIGFIYKLGVMTLIGGSVAHPCNFTAAADHATTSALNTVKNQRGASDSQFFCTQNVQSGNGATDTYWDCSFQSIEYPSAYSAADISVAVNVGEAVFEYIVKGFTGNTFKFLSATFNMGNFHKWTIDAATSNTDIYDFSGLNILNATVTLQDKALIDYSGMTFSGCKELILNGADLSGGNTVSSSVDNQAVTVTSEAEFHNLDNCTFSNNKTYAITITGDQSGSWSDPNIVMSGHTSDIQYTGTTNFSIQSALPISVDNTSTGVLTVVTPVLTLNINSDTAATLIRYFEDDSQTVVDSTTGTTLAYSFPDTDVIDIELLKQSYVPVNRQDVTPFDGDFDVLMDFDESYNSGHGLSITTEYDYVRATKVLTINSDQNALDVRSSLADVIRTNSSYFNTALLMQSIPGLTRVDLTDGMTITSMATWKGAGMEMFDAADPLNPLEKWAAIKSVGDITGSTTHFRQTDSGNSIALPLTNNVVDEALQYWDDPDHDGIPTTDTSNYLLIKSFLAGSKQARVDVLANAGISELASNLFTVPLANADHGYSGSDPGITGDLTLITGGTFGGKVFAYEIVDGGVNTGADIADQFNFNAANNPNTVIPGGTGLRYFELSDMVIHNASAVETERGFEEGTTPTLVGFYCSRASADHPGFTRFQADDGTYFTPAVTSNVSITGMPAVGNEIRLQIYNETARTATAWASATAYTEGDKVLRSTGLGVEQTAGLYFVATTGGTSGGGEPSWDTTVGNTTADNTVTWTTFAILFTDADPVGTGFADSYTDGEEFIGGDTFRVRFAELDTTTSFKTFETTGIVSSSGFAAAVDAIADVVYAINGIDGSSTAVTDIYTADYANDEIDLDTNLDFTNPKSFAFVSFEQTTSQGMFQIWRIVTAIDAANYRNNVDVLGILFDETAGFVKQEDGDTSRWFRSDGNRPFKDPTTGGNGISMNWKNPVFTISTGSVLTALEKSQLSTSASESTAVNVKIGVPVVTVSDDIANISGGGGDATQAKQDQILSELAVVDGNVDAILVDTSTDIPADIAAVKSDTSQIKAKTDELTFTKANELDSNIQSVNDVTVDGTGVSGDEWRPA